MKSLDFLFAPASIALVGAAHTERKLGGAILRNLLRFRGRVYPVNPKYAELMGLKAYPSVKEIPSPCDLVLILRPAAEVPEILRELEGISQCAVVMSSGFREAGRSDLQEEVRRAGREKGIRILGPNCMGVLNPYRRLDTFFVPRERLKRPKRGNVAVLSQSGAVMTSLFDALSVSHAGISKAVGYGNAADIDEADLFEYLAEDRETAVVVSYIESLGDGRRFIAKAVSLTEKKSLVVLKSGKGPGGQAAAFSHTGRLAGRYEVFQSVLRQFGIREAKDFDELIDSTKALSFLGPSGRPPALSKRFGGAAGNRVCIITNGGGSGVLAADECMRQGLDVPAVSEERKKELRKEFPEFYGLNNPIDLTPQVKDDEYAAVIDAVKEDYDGFLIIALTGVLGITEGLARALGDFKKRNTKPITVHTANNGMTGRRLTTLLERAGIPVYPSPERAVRGLKALLA